MPSVALDNHFDLHPKLLAASNAAYRLMVSILCHCSRNLTDGFVDDTSIAVLAQKVGTMGTVDELVGLGLVERVAGGYEAHDYLDFNPSAEQVRRERAQTAERKKRLRARRHAPTREGTPVGGTRFVDITTTNGVSGSDYLLPQTVEQPPRGGTTSIELDELGELARALDMSLSENEQKFVRSVIEQYRAVQPVTVAHDFMAWQNRNIDAKKKGENYGKIYKDRITGWHDQMVRRASEGREKYLRPEHRATAPVQPAPLNGYAQSPIALWNQLRQLFIALNQRKDLPCRQLESWAFEQIEAVAFDGEHLTLRPHPSLHQQDRKQWPGIVEQVSREHLHTPIHVEWSAS